MPGSSLCLPLLPLYLLSLLHGQHLGLLLCLPASCENHAWASPPAYALNTSIWSVAEVSLYNNGVRRRRAYKSRRRVTNSVFYLCPQNIAVIARETNGSVDISGSKTGSYLAASLALGACADARAKIFASARNAAAPAERRQQPRQTAFRCLTLR